MKAADKVVKGASVLVLGYTFKENCADTRNAKVRDIVHGLEGFSCQVSIFDPYLSVDYNSNFISNPFDSGNKYDAIIVAVSHDEFIKYTHANFNQISQGKLVLLYLKVVCSKSTWKF